MRALIFVLAWLCVAASALGAQGHQSTSLRPPVKVPGG
jgi:hypothetical protein